MTLQPNPVDLPVRDACILTTDLSRAIAFWRDVVGLTPRQIRPHFADFETGGAVLALWDREHFVRHVGIEAGARADGVMIAVQYPDRVGVDRAYAALAGRGVLFTAPPRRYDWGAYACYFQDPDGTVIELYGWGE